MCVHTLTCTWSCKKLVLVHNRACHFPAYKHTVVQIGCQLTLACCHWCPHAPAQCLVRQMPSNQGPGTNFVSISTWDCNVQAAKGRHATNHSTPAATPLPQRESLRRRQQQQQQQGCSLLAEALLSSEFSSSSSNTAQSVEQLSAACRGEGVDAAAGQGLSFEVLALQEQSVAQCLQAGQAAKVIQHLHCS